MILTDTIPVSLCLTHIFVTCSRGAFLTRWVCSSQCSLKPLGRACCACPPLFLSSLTFRQVPFHQVPQHSARTIIHSGDSSMLQASKITAKQVLHKHHLTSHKSLPGNLTEVLTLLACWSDMVYIYWCPGRLLFK